jgi:hypothetical protein
MDIRLFSPNSLSLILSVYAVEGHLRQAVGQGDEAK